MNSSYGAWGDWGKTQIQTPQTGYPTRGQTILAQQMINKSGYTPPQAQVTVAAPVSKGPSLEEILAGIGSLIAPKQVTDQQVAAAETAAAAGGSKPPWMLIGLGVGGVVILGVGAYFLLRAKRRR